MSKRGLLIASAVMAVLTLVSVLLFVHNASVISEKSITAFGVGSVPDVGYWDALVTISTLMFGGTSGVGSFAFAVLAFIKQQAPAVLDKYLPGASDNVKAGLVDTTQIGLIQAALKVVKDEPTRKSLNDAGRSAFDDLKNRTFPEVVTQ